MNNNKSDAFDMHNYYNMWSGFFKNMQDYAPMQANFTKMMESFTSKMDFSYLLDQSSKKNPFNMMLKNFNKWIEDSQEVNKMMSDNMQESIKKRAEILQKHVSDFFKVVKDLSMSASPEGALARNAEYVKGSFSEMLSDLKELMGLYSKSNLDAFDILSKKNIKKYGNIYGKSQLILNFDFEI